MQLNDNFYHYTLNQHRQDLSPYPWPTLEQFRATVAWLGDIPNFQEERRPADAQGAAQGNGEREEDDKDMADLVDYFIRGD